MTDKRVLIVDDEESILFTFSKFLRDRGYLAETALTYESAVEKLKHYEYDLVFADIILGGKSGIELLREIRELGLNCSVIIVTGAPEVDTASEALRLGAFDYIVKPVRRDTLLLVSQKAINHKTLTDEKERYRSTLETIFSNIDDAIITFDERLVIREVNEAAEKICGITHDMIGKELGAVSNGCKLRCRDALAEGLRKSKSIELFRTECLHVDKPRRVVSLRVSPFRSGKSSFSGCVMVVRDETRISELEHDLKDVRQFYNIVGKSERMQMVYSMIKNLSDVSSTVLLTGESGTGKELVAEALHYSGIRSNGPLVKVNCSALPESLLESELFGHVKGAFTGALSDKTGRFQKADGGTIFLDEIGDISPRMQLRLLRVLQEKEFERVGDSMTIRVDVRVVAATNQDLGRKMASGQFREDLFYRLNVVTVHLPPLRERRQDIPLLVEYFLRKIGKRIDKRVEAVSDEVMKVFMSSRWPGNVRQLQNVLEHSIILCRGSTITIEDLPDDFRIRQDTGAEGPEERVAYDSLLIAKTLEKTGWNKARAARLLGISRRTLYRKLKEYNIRM